MKAFIKLFSGYGFVTAFNKFMAFLLMLILSRYLSPKDMGIYALFSIYVALAVPLTHLGAVSSIQVEYFKLEKEQLRLYISSALFPPLVLIVIYSLLMLLLGSTLTNLMEVPSTYLLLIPICAAMRIVPQIVSFAFIATNEKNKYAYYNIGLNVLIFLLCILFVFYGNMKWEAKVWGILLGYATFTALGIYILTQRNLIGLQISRKLMMASITFGLPLIVHIIGSILIDMSDRLFVAKLVSIEDAGIYNIGYKFGSIIILVQNTFLLIWSPFLYKHLKEDQTPANKQNIVKHIYYLVFLLALGLLSLPAGADIVFKYFMTANYQGATQYIFWISLGYSFLALYNVLVGFLLYDKRTKLMGYITVANLVFSLALNYLFVLYFGAIGAAYATAICYVILFIVCFFIVQKKHQLPWLYFYGKN